MKGNIYHPILEIEMAHLFNFWRHLNGHDKIRKGVNRKV